MGVLNTHMYIVNKPSGDRERIYLYDDFTQFVDYGRFGNESYISIYIDDDGQITGQGPAVTGYIYASSQLFTKLDGTPTDCHVFDYIGANGVLMHAYTRIPDIREDLVESFTSSGGNVTLIDNPDDFRHGAVLYLVSSKGNNGNKGGSGGQASGAYRKDSNGNYKNYVYRGNGGSGGSGGSGGKGVSINLTLANFLEDGTVDFDNGVTTGTITHAGEAGAGGGGGGGGEGGIYDSDLDWSAGSGGSGGYANVASQTNRIYIPHNVAVKCTSYSYTSGPSGASGNSGGGGGSNSSDWTRDARISGGWGGSGGKSGNGTSGTSGGAPWGGSDNYRGGNGGAGASENNVSTKTTVDKTIDGKRVYTTNHTASSSYSIANSLASTGGMALAKLVPYYTN